jgi:hypothetical protein
LVFEGTERRRRRRRRRRRWSVLAADASVAQKLDGDW